MCAAVQLAGALLGGLSLTTDDPGSVNQYRLWAIVLTNARRRGITGHHAGVGFCRARFVALFSLDRSPHLAGTLP